LSLDGLETTHDLIRRIPGGFRKTLSTAEWLLKHAMGFSALSSTISSTVMRANLAEVEPLIEYLQNRGLRSKIAFVRGNSFSTFNVPDILLKKNYESNELPASVEELEGLVRRLKVRFPDFFDEYAHRKLTTAMLTLRKRSRHLPCFAGDRDGVVYHDGHVGICEQVLPFGHLSMWDWNLDSAWNSIEAQTHRKLLRQCACIHGCNLSTSVAMAMP
jgi:MoaA/NifB/PqqE/SkfB family radical SAM enzyme